MLSGIALDVSQSYSLNGKRSGLTLELTDTYLTSGGIPQPHEDDPSIHHYLNYGEEALTQLLADPKGETYLPKNTHQAQTIGLFRDFNVGNDAGVSTGRGVNVTVQFKAVKANIGQNFGKTVYGVLNGWDHLISLPNDDE